MADSIFIGKNQLGIRMSRKAYGLCQFCIPAHAGFLIELDHIGHEDGVGAAMGNVENGADFMGQGMGNAEETIGEGHTGEALGDVHLAPGLLIPVVGFQDVIKNIGNSLFG